MKRTLFISAFMLTAAIAIAQTTWNIGYPIESEMTATFSGTTLTISGKGEMQHFFAFPRSWDSIRENIETLVIEEDVTAIGTLAFYDCRALSSISLPESLKTIGEWAFHNCIALSSITLPESIETIGDRAFLGCSGLSGTLTLPKSLETIGEWAFCGCVRLSALIIPEGVKVINRYAFSGCIGLSSITLPESLETIGGFAFCCTDLSSITIPKNVTSIGEAAFYGCYGLSCSIILPEGVKKINEYTFYGCIGLSSVTIPEDITTIGGYAFSGCSNLSSVTNLADEPQNIYAYSTTFNGLTLSNITLYVPEASIAKYQKADVWKEFKIAAITGVQNLSPDEPAVVGYYSPAGVKLPQEPTSGTYIIMYDNGKAVKTIGRR